EQQLAPPLAMARKLRGGKGTLTPRWPHGLGRQPRAAVKGTPMKLHQELTWALRRVVRHPASAAGIVLTLTLGIAIRLGMVSVLNGVVLRALPYPDADRIVLLHSQNLEQNVPRASLTAAEAALVVTGVPGFEHTAVYSWGG